MSRVVCLITTGHSVKRTNPQLLTKAKQSDANAKQGKARQCTIEGNVSNMTELCNMTTVTDSTTLHCSTKLPTPTQDVSMQ